MSIHNRLAPFQNENLRMHLSFILRQKSPDSKDFWGNASVVEESEHFFTRFIGHVNRARRNPPRCICMDILIEPVCV